MSRLLPRLLLGGAIFALWVTLNGADPLNLLAAAALAIALPRLTAALRPWPVSLSRPVQLVLLVLRVGVYVLESAAHVIKALVRRRPARGAFVRIPLELRDASGLAALAVITTVTPGTVWTELAPDRSAILLHIFDLEDEAIFIAHYKERYERPLKEIFE